MSTDSQYINGRIVGGYSRHDAHDPTKCRHNANCNYACVDCCGVEKDRDIVECVTCGHQKSIGCTFDDDFQ